MYFEEETPQIWILYFIAENQNNKYIFEIPVFPRSVPLSEVTRSSRDAVAAFGGSVGSRLSWSTAFVRLYYIGVAFVLWGRFWFSRTEKKKVTRVGGNSDLGLTIFQPFSHRHSFACLKLNGPLHSLESSLVRLSDRTKSAHRFEKLWFGRTPVTKNRLRVCLECVASFPNCDDGRKRSNRWFHFHVGFIPERLFFSADTTFLRLARESRRCVAGPSGSNETVKWFLETRNRVDSVGWLCFVGKPISSEIRTE